MKNLNDLDWTDVLKKICLFASSDIAKDSIRDTQPLKHHKEAYQKQKQVEDVQLMLSEIPRPQLESLDFFLIWFERVKKQAVLNPQEFKDVRRFCFDIHSFRVSFKEYKNNWKDEIETNLVNERELLAAIDQIITEDGGIRTDASETLFRLNSEKNELEAQIRKTLDKLVKDHSVEHILQDKYVTTRDGRWVLPVKSGMRSGIKGIIHDISQSKQTVFMEPQDVVDTNNRLRQVLSGIDEEINKLLQQLSQFLFERNEAIYESYLRLITADKEMAIATFSNKIQARTIEFSSQMDLKSVRHPLLAYQMGDEVVPNTMCLPKDNKVLILSGPNAGGKTVLLKSVGLAAQMARCGLPICCDDESAIPFFNNIYIDIGDSQSVDENLSTFAAHLKNLTEASKSADRNDLILIDEICGSTDPEEGAALARSFVEHFASNNSYAIITSHLGPLKTGWDKDSGVLSGSMEYDETSHKATYQLVMGIHGRSFALKTAKVVGVPEEIVTRALEFLDPDVKKREMKLDELEDLRNEILKIKAHLKSELFVVQKQKDKYKSMVHQFEKEKEKKLEKYVLDTKEKLDLEVRRHKRESKPIDFSTFKANMPELVKSTGQSKNNTPPESAKEFEERCPPGTKVFVKSLNQDAIVQGVPNQKGDVLILSNSMRLNIPWGDIQILTRAEKKSSQSASTKFVDDHSGPRVIDLRGKRVEEALEELEVELDQAAVQSEDRVKIIHGHGTEALKKAVRAYLSRSVYVKKWMAGDSETESDGITWANI